MRFPQQLKPGKYSIAVVAQDIQLEQGTVSAIASSKIQFTLQVLSPDKRIDITETRVPPVPEGVDANVSVFVVSRTSQDIQAIFLESRVYKDGVLVTTSNSEPVSLLSKESAILLGTIDTSELVGGEYQVNATVHFDGYSNYTSTEILKIGTLHVGLEGHTTEFIFNTTNQFLFNISNKWNRELQEVYTRVDIGSQSKKSASQNIAPFRNTQYELYFDREEAILPGPVVANITVSFKDYDVASKTYVLKQESFPAQIQVVLPPVPEKKWWEGDTLVYVIIGGITLIVLLILVLIIVMLLKKTVPAKTVPSQTTSAATEKPVVSGPVSMPVSVPVKQAPVSQSSASDDEWKPPKMK
jgi:hypothetical protein